MVRAPQCETVLQFVVQICAPNVHAQSSIWLLSWVFPCFQLLVLACIAPLLSMETAGRSVQRKIAQARCSRSVQSAVRVAERCAATNSRFKISHLAWTHSATNCSTRRFGVSWVSLALNASRSAARLQVMHPSFRTWPWPDLRIHSDTCLPRLALESRRCDLEFKKYVPDV